MYMTVDLVIPTNEDIEVRWCGYPNDNDNTGLELLELFTFILMQFLRLIILNRFCIPFIIHFVQHAMSSFNSFVPSKYVR